MMKFSDCLHESADAHGVASGGGRVARVGVPHKFFRPVVHSIELSNLVAEADALEEGLDLFAVAGELEIVFTDAQLGEGRREQKVNGFWFVTIIL